jgi:hypothetical protein
MGKQGKKKEKLVGYLVVTTSLLVGTKVYRRGDFIDLEEAGDQLNYAYGVHLIEPVYAPDEQPGQESTEPKLRMLKSLPVFWKM